MVTELDIIIVIAFIFALFGYLYYKIKQHIDDVIKTIPVCTQKEPFLVSDALNLQDYKKLSDETKQLPNTFDDAFKTPAVQDTLKYEPKLDYAGIKYNEKTADIPTTKNSTKSYINYSDFGTDAPYPAVSCSNSSINEKYVDGPLKLLPNQISCGRPNGLTAENFYKTFYNAKSIPMDNDKEMKGYNYEVYSNFSNPYNINQYILSYNTKGLAPDQTKYKNLPVGFGYAFHNTPALAMP